MRRALSGVCIVCVFVCLCVCVCACLPACLPACLCTGCLSPWGLPLNQLVHTAHSPICQSRCAQLCMIVLSSLLCSTHVDHPITPPPQPPPFRSRPIPICTHCVQGDAEEAEARCRETEGRDGAGVGKGEGKCGKGQSKCGQGQGKCGQGQGKCNDICNRGSRSQV